MNRFPKALPLLASILLVAAFGYVLFITFTGRPKGTQIVSTEPAKSYRVKLDFEGLSVDTIQPQKLRRYLEASAEWKVMRPSYDQKYSTSDKLCAERRILWDDPAFEDTRMQRGRTDVPELSLILGLEPLSPHDRNAPTISQTTFEPRQLDLEINESVTQGNELGPNGEWKMQVRTWYLSSVLFTGKNFWVTIREKSLVKDRKMTAVALRKLATELEDLRNSPPEGDLPFASNLLSSGSVISEATEHSRGISLASRPEIFMGRGFINMGEPGYLCWNTKSDQSGPQADTSNDFESCRKRGFYMEYPGWSSDLSKRFAISLSPAWHASVDGEDYPYTHQEMLWFIPDSSKRPKLVLITPNEHGIAKKTEYKD